MGMIDAMRDYLFASPLFESGGETLQVDFMTDRSPVVGIYPLGGKKCASYLDGAADWERSFTVYVKRYCESDRERRETVELLDRFFLWVEENNRRGIFPVLNAGATPLEVRCGDGALLEYDEDAQTATYRLLLTLFYERE